MSTGGISLVGRGGAFLCRLSRNSGSPNLLEPWGFVQGLLHLSHAPRVGNVCEYRRSPLIGRYKSIIKTVGNMILIVLFINPMTSEIFFYFLIVLREMLGIWEKKNSRKFYTNFFVFWWLVVEVFVYHFRYWLYNHLNPSLFCINTCCNSTFCPQAVFHSFIHSLVFSLRGRAGRNQSPVMWPVWLWHTASWASSWG